MKRKMMENSIESVRDLYQSYEKDNLLYQINY
jgi:hypothetical protein